jgi:pimeloyl-ACP methyl ester carboxylesterase
VKLVLLPGLDGTGKLFAPILPFLADNDFEVLPLPGAGPQTYAELSVWIRNRLPAEDFVLVAESFSGPIAALTTQDATPHLKGIVFVASFLTQPAPKLSRLAGQLPLKTLTYLPFSNLAIRFLCLGRGGNDDLVELFKETVRTVPSNVLKARLRELGRFTIDLTPVTLPACLLRPDGDLLVGGRSTESIRDFFPLLDVQTLDGPHFLLQAKPREVAEHITRFLQSF